MTVRPASQPATPRVPASVGTGCLVLFLLPFAATGVGTGIGALREAVAGDWEAAAFLGLFGLTFGLVGLGGIVAVLRAGRVAAEAEALRARHPEAPWLWRADWAAGRVEDGSRGTMVAAWIFAAFWNLISIPGAYFGVRQALEDERRGALLVLLFPAVGLGLLVWALRATLRYRRYGISRLALATVPAPVGRELRGTVEAPAVLEAPGVLLTLTCLRRVTRGSGKNRSTSETVLWQEEQRATPSGSRTAAGTATSIPVAFRIPADAQPADETNPRDRVLWRLAVSAAVPGVDYHSTFEVPVFRGGEAESELAGDSPPPAVATSPFVPPATSRITVSRTRRGTEIDFPAARNPGASAGLTAFLAIWMLAVWATVHLDAPLPFQVIFGAVGLLLAWAVAASWFGVSRVTVGDGAVTVAYGVFAPVREQRMAVEEIGEVVTRIGMQAGGTPYYDLVLVRRDGRRVPAGRSIRDKREAEWLADTVRKALNA